jgi:membrane protein
MAGDEMPKWKKIYTGAVDFFEERGIESDERFLHSRLHRFAHFWLLVGKNFIRNRCHVRASALAYTTLLALVPLLAVGMSITTSMLQKRGAEPVNELINKLVNYVAPALDLEERVEETPVAIETNAAPDVATNTTALQKALVSSNAITGSSNIAGSTNIIAGSTNAAPTTTGRARVVKQITSFIANIKTGTLGATSLVALLFVGISLLRTIEATFNDIWGVTRARSWFKSIVYYWAAITLGPMLLVLALTLTTGRQFGQIRAWLEHVPLLGVVLFHALPFVILSLGFAGFYAVMPNTRVQFRAALAGGIVGGCLWQLNNLFNVLYVSRVMTYTNIYGSLGIIPLFLVGLYFSWLIMLFGAQVAYAWQNRAAYILEKQAGSISQRGREFIALRLMTHLAQNFAQGGRPLSTIQLSKQLAIPGQLTQKVLCTLTTAGLLVEVADTDNRFSPGRPLERITAYDIIAAMRAGSGFELSTTEDDVRGLVRAEFERMIVAERDAGASVTLQTLTELAAKQVGNGAKGALEAETSTAHKVTSR